jgi:hypothetical protein
MEAYPRGQPGNPWRECGQSRPRGSFSIRVILVLGNDGDDSRAGMVVPAARSAMTSAACRPLTRARCRALVRLASLPAILSNLIVVE